MYQFTLEDMVLQQQVKTMPGRTAFIDECGSFGFDFTTSGASKLYILCAIVVNDSDILELRKQFLDVKKQNGYEHVEMKSSNVGSNYQKRSRIMNMLMPIPFRISLLIVDKEAFLDGTPIKEYKKTFIKFLHSKMYEQLYQVYPKLKIIEDEIGTTEFQQSFRKYVEERRAQYNLLNEYDFDYTDSKDEILVQLADFVGGSIYKSLVDSNSPNYLEMLKAKIMSSEEFPRKNEPYWGTTNPKDCNFDNQIYTLAVKCARDYIGQHQEETGIEIKAQIAFLKHLLFYVENISPIHYVTSYEIRGIIQEYVGQKISRDFLFRRIVAPLRDKHVILASSNKGYKIPISVDDITTYFNQTHMTVAPMLHRMNLCRSLVLQETDGNLDVLNDPAFSRYKNYFEN